MRDNCLLGPKYCPKCGKELDIYDIRCKFCGTNLRKLNINKKEKENEQKR